MSPCRLSMGPTHPISDEVEWWLCSHLVSFAVSETSAEGGVALIEEISEVGVRFVVEEPIGEGSRAHLRSGAFEVGVAVTGCSVRADDFQVEARFDGGFQWSPEVWSPDHLFRPPRPERKARGASHS